jgi:hypothetical protein
MLSYPPDDAEDRIARQVRRDRLARQQRVKNGKRSITFHFDGKWSVEFFIGGIIDFAQSFDFYDQAISYMASKPCTDWLAKLTDDSLSRLESF